jgi:hypothetical protein
MGVRSASLAGCMCISHRMTATVVCFYGIAWMGKGIGHDVKIDTLSVLYVVPKLFGGQVGIQ